MKIKVAKYAGFCEGVRRAVAMALDHAQKSSTPVYTWGELIHNPQVISLLRKKGVKDLSDLEDARGGSLLIRSHGISPAHRRRAESIGLPVVDATCPHVLRIHNIITKAASEGATTIVVGDAGHAEVEGLVGCAGDSAYVIGKLEEAEKLPEINGNICVVAQTTQDEEVFDRIAARLKERFPQANFHRTICSSTRLRQEEIRGMSSEADAVVVVGGRNSANTARLAQIANASGVPVFHIEMPEELDSDEMSRFETVVVTAGASTPNWIIRNVVNRLMHIGRSPLRRRFEPLFAFVRFFAISNLYVAAGAGSATFASSLLMGIKPDWRYALIAFLSILSLHTVNQYLAAREASYFFNQGRKTASVATRLAGAAVSAVAAVFIAAGIGWFETFLVAIGLGLGSIYGMSVAPAAFRRITGFRSLRDIPASKDLFAAAGWTVLVVGLPAMSDWSLVPLSTLICVSILIFVMVYVRSTLLDIGEIERDRAVGREATPFVLGKKRTKGLLLALVCGLPVLLAAGYAAGVFPILAVYLCAVPLYMACYLYLYHKRLVMREISLELLVDGKFIVAGSIALLWYWAL